MNVDDGCCSSCADTPPLTSNVKVSFTLTCAFWLRKHLAEIKCGSIVLKDADIKYGHNYVVLRKHPFVFVIFPSIKSSQELAHVNATKIKSFDEIEHATKLFCQTFALRREEHVINLTVDNSTSTGRFCIAKNKFGTIDLEQFKSCVNSALANRHDVSGTASINPRYPSRVIIRFVKLGTLILFSSGKFNCLGSKCISHPLEMFLCLKSVVAQCTACTNQRFVTMMR